MEDPPTGGSSSVAAGADADPNAEDHLLDTTKKEGVAAVRDEANRVRAAARTNEGTHHERIRRQRHLRKWTDADGAGRIDGKFTPEALAAIWNALDPYREQIFRQARQAGTRDNYDAYTADALEAMAMAHTQHQAAAPTTSPSAATSGRSARSSESGTAEPATSSPSTGTDTTQGGPDRRSDLDDPFAHPNVGQSPDNIAPPDIAAPDSDLPDNSDPPGHPKRRPRANIHIRVDLAAWNRGFTKPGEVCEIPGFGPIPVTTAHEYATDAVLWALLTDGTDVTRAANLTRTLTAAQRAALTERDRHCPVPSCPATTFLQAHHLIAWADSGPTELWNMALPCPHHHDLITHHGYRLDRHTDGTWTWHTPHNTPDRPPASPPAQPAAPTQATLDLRPDERGPTTSSADPTAHDDAAAA